MQCPKFGGALPVTCFVACCDINKTIARIVFLALSIPETSDTLVSLISPKVELAQSCLLRGSFSRSA